MKFILPLTFVFIISACSDNRTSEDYFENEDSTLVFLENDSRANSQSIDSCKLNFVTFKSLFDEHGYDIGYTFYVKVPFADKDETEHMWIELKSIDNDSLHGILENEPEFLKNVGYGDTVNFSNREIEDMLVYKMDSVLFGSFLEKILK